MTKQVWYGVQSWSLQTVETHLELSPSTLLAAVTSTDSVAPFLVPYGSSPTPIGAVDVGGSAVRHAMASLYPAPAISAEVVSCPTTSRDDVISLLLQTAPPDMPPTNSKQVWTSKYFIGISVHILSPGVLPFIA